MFDSMKYHYSKGYCLILSDKSNWWITGIDEYSEHVESFAKILNLKECPMDDSSKLIFLDNNNLKDRSSNEVKSALLSSGWKFYNYKYVNIWYNQKNSDAICEITTNNNDIMQSSEQFYFSLWLSLQPIYRRSIKLGGLPFHSGLAEFNGKGVIFSAKGNVGKTTCCKRLPSHWKALCDDETLVTLNGDNKYNAHPFPTWSEYLSNKAENTWDTQYSVPLFAIFFIEQSKNDEVIPIDSAEATILIVKSAEQVWEKYLKHSHQTYKVAFRKEIFNNATKIAKQIPAYRLRVSLTGKFWEEIEKVI